ncbi:MerR family transcriptional regulator [soil metagenome]
MSVYTVSQVARLSGVSVRALHHYDEIGLLKPGHVGENGYRYYGQDELLRLQQILFHRELGFRLEAIGKILDDPGFDHAGALRAHRKALLDQAQRYRQLVRTLDQTLAALEGKRDMNDKAVFRGFSPEKQAAHEAWLTDRFGDDVRAEIECSKQRMHALSQGQFDNLVAEVEALEIEIADAMAKGIPADSAAVGALIARHHAWIGRSWNRSPSAEAYRNLALIYEDNPDFRARYEGRAVGFTEYLVAAMRAFADRELS